MGLEGSQEMMRDHRNGDPVKVNQRPTSGGNYGNWVTSLKRGISHPTFLKARWRAEERWVRNNRGLSEMGIAYVDELLPFKSSGMPYFFIFLYRRVRWMPSILAAVAFL